MSFINKNYHILLLFIFSLVFTNQLIYLFFNITQSPDFIVYSSYFDYFFGLEESIKREQGLLYFYLNSISAYINFENFNSNYSDLFLHKSIHQINSLIYTYGLVGYYFLLKKFDFTKKNIFLTLIFLNFFPITFALRMTMKPEILAFSLLPWLIYFLEAYLEKKEFRYLIFSTPYIAIIAISKGSIFIMCGIFILFGYIVKIYKTNSKYFIVFLLLALTSIASLNYENIKSGGNNLFDIASGTGEEISIDASKYDNKASIDFVYKVNMFDLFTNPIKHVHKDSFISITLLDTFNDYFDLYWNNNDSLFFEDRIEFIELKKSQFIESPKINETKNKLTIFVQKETDLYLRSTVGFIIGLLFYFFLLKNIIYNKKYRYFLVAPVFGMLILLIHVISGYPKNNFDPLTGDTLKPYYYSFLLCLAFVFLIIKMLEKNKYFSFLLIPYIILILFIFGFPKEIENQINTLVDVNKESTICELNRLYIQNDLNTNYCSIYEIGSDKDEFIKFSNKINHPKINVFFLLSLLLTNVYLIYSSNYLRKTFEKLPLKINKKSNK